MSNLNMRTLNLERRMAYLISLISKDKTNVGYDINAGRVNTSRAQKSADDANELARENETCIMDVAGVASENDSAVMDVAEIASENDAAIMEVAEYVASLEERIVELEEIIKNKGE